VNRYGDEYNSLNDASIIATIRPGLGIWYRTGYLEKDLVDYDARNLKTRSRVFITKWKKKMLNWFFASNFGTGTTVYQGDNRYSLKDILFFQNRFEMKKEK